MKIVYEQREKYTMFTLKVIIFETPPTKRDIFSWFSWIYFFKKKVCKSYGKKRINVVKIRACECFSFPISYVVDSLHIKFNMNMSSTELNIDKKSMNNTIHPPTFPF